MATSVTVKSIPDDVHDIILEVQVDLKKKKKIEKYSLESTIIHIIREYDRCGCRKQIK